MIEKMTADLFKLSDKLFDIRNKLADGCYFRVDDQDARLIALNGMQKCVLSCGYWLNLYNNLLKFDQNGSEILKLAHSNLSFKLTDKIMIDQIRIGLIIFFHFKVENLFTRLVEKLKNGRSRSLGILFKELAQELELNDIEIKEKIILAFSSIRNSLHNNGIHNKESFTVNINNIEYTFKKGEPVQCASLFNSINLLNTITEIIQGIVLSERVLNMKQIIPDPFSEWKYKINKK